MKAILARYLLSLATDPDKLIKVLLGVIGAVMLVLIVVVTIPVMIFTHVPLAKNTNHVEFYENAVNQVYLETNVMLNWQTLMAVDAVLLEQDFDKSSDKVAYETAMRFIREEEILVQQTCFQPYHVVDDYGNVSTIWIPYDCSYIEIHYFAKSIDEVLEDLIREGKLRREQIEDVKRYMTLDISFLKEEAGYDFLPGGNLPPANFVPVERMYDWPTPGINRVTSAFGLRIDPVSKNYLGFHNGIDIGAPTGAEVVAIQSGTIVYAERRGNAGNAIKIQHEDGSESLYFHLSAFSVKEGDQVQRGQLIGLVGNTGRTTGPHLHFEMVMMGRKVDPLAYYQ